MSGREGRCGPVATVDSACALFATRRRPGGLSLSLQASRTLVFDLTKGAAEPTLTAVAPPDRRQSKAIEARTERDRPAAASSDAMLICPNCGKRLSERKCKLFCPDPLCGYYLSCSDYY